MLRKGKRGIEWLEFQLLQPYKVRHGVFLRLGGVSLKNFASLNAAFGVGDLEEHVHENRSRIRDIVDIQELYFVNQIHQKEIILVSGRREGVPLADGMMTKERELGLCIQHADCQAALFYDPVQHVLASVHAGWRGSVANIYGAVVEKLQQTFQSKPQDLLVCISPSLGPAHAEFIHYRTELPRSFWTFQAYPHTPLFDFWQITRWQLETLGIPPKQIEIASLCTYLHHKEFFSYRRDKITGRHLTVAALL